MYCTWGVKGLVGRQENTTSGYKGKYYYIAPETDLVGDHDFESLDIVVLKKGGYMGTYTECVKAEINLNRNITLESSNI